MEQKLWKMQYRLAPYAFIAPFFILFTIFLLYPFFYSIYLSFMEWNGSTTKTYVGLQNYADLLGSETFWTSLANSIKIFFMYVPIMLLMALIFAVLLNQKWMRAKGFLRTAFFVPNITSVVALAFVFSMMFNTNQGLINTMLINMGVIKESIPWLETPIWAQLSVSMMVFYRWMGYNMLLLLAGLQNIPADLYESAKVDGANAVQVFRYITLPMVRKILAFCTILSTIGTFSLFTEPFILTRSGPADSTLTPVLLLYRESFQNFNFGYASAISICFFVLMMLLTVVQLRMFDDQN